MFYFNMNRIYIIIAVLIVLIPSGASCASGDNMEKLHQKALMLSAGEKYAESLKTYEELLKEALRKFGSNNVKVAEVLSEMAPLYQHISGKENKSAALREKAKQIKMTLNGSLDCQPPKDWSYEPCRERWLGEDPCFVFRKSNDYIKVTYYGLDGSEFKTPDGFINHLKELIGEFRARDKFTIDSLEATRIKLEYQTGNRQDRDGMFIPPMFLYEEFMILPLKKGFLVFNFNLNRLSPFVSDFTLKNVPEDLYNGARDEYSEWQAFTGGCKTNPQSR